MSAPKMTDQEILNALAEFTVLHATRPTTHTDIMCTALRVEAKIRGIVA